MYNPQYNIPEHEVPYQKCIIIIIEQVKRLYLEGIDELYFLGQKQLILQLGVDHAQCVGNRLIVDLCKLTVSLCKVNSKSM